MVTLITGLFLLADPASGAQRSTWQEAMLAAQEAVLKRVAEESRGSAFKPYSSGIVREVAEGLVASDMSLSQ